MQAHSINRYRIDWPSFREAVYAAAPNAQTIADLRATAIRTSLGLLGDHHSFYVGSNGVSINNPSTHRTCSDPPAGPIEAPDGVGYVRISGFTGPDLDAFAISVEDQIRAADAPGLVGWIVDLRGNGGGDMWPMIAGVGAVLGEGTAGAFVDPDNTVYRWGYADGASFAGDIRQVQMPAPYSLYLPNPRVAVLTDCRLSDGGFLYLATSTMADRNLTRYGDVVIPDEVTGTPAEAVQRAIAWLTGS